MGENEQCRCTNSFFQKHRRKNCLLRKMGVGVSPSKAGKQSTGKEDVPTEAVVTLWRPKTPPMAVVGNCYCSATVTYDHRKGICDAPPEVRRAIDIGAHVTPEKDSLGIPAASSHAVSNTGHRPVTMVMSSGPDLSGINHHGAQPNAGEDSDVPSEGTLSSTESMRRERSKELPRSGEKADPTTTVPTSPTADARAALRRREALPAPTPAPASMPALRPVPAPHSSTTAVPTLSPPASVAGVLTPITGQSLPTPPPSTATTATVPVLSALRHAPLGATTTYPVTSQVPVPVPAPTEAVDFDDLMAGCDFHSGTPDEGSYRGSEDSAGSQADAVAAAVAQRQGEEDRDYDFAA